MKTHLLTFLLLLGFSLGSAQQITLDTSATSTEQGVIEQFWYWSGGFPVLGEGFTPNTEIKVFATDPSGTPWRNFTANSDNNGNFSIQISAKKIRSILGEHTITVTDGTNTVTKILTVTANHRETLTASTQPVQLTLSDFNDQLTVKAEGFVPNTELRVHIFSPNEDGSSIEPQTPKFSDSEGKFEMNINLNTQSYPWGESMPQVPGKWRISFEEWTTENYYGEAPFRVLPDNPSVSNYCSVGQIPNATSSNGVYPITSFEIVGVAEANVSSLDSDIFHEDFTDLNYNLTAGQTYTVRMKGKNGSSFAPDTYTMFIDWNQNGILDEDNEIIHEGYIFGSTGADDKVTEFQITIPENAFNGNTRLRILKLTSATTYSMFWPEGSCGSYITNGQAEDYTLTISGGINAPDCSFECPDDIVVQAQQGADSAVVEYDLAFDCEPTQGTCEVDYPGNSENLIGIVAPIVASDFELPAGTSTVTQVEANIARAMFSSSANIYIYQDNNGAPGALITSFENVDYVSRVDAGTIGGSPVYKSTWKLPEPIDLQGGKYWLGINIGGPVISWETTTNISNSTIHSSYNSGTSWTAEEGIDGVFKIVYECTQDPSNQTEIVLVEGLASGSEFPIGTTTVIHNLVYQGVVIDTCSFDVTVDEYMNVSEVDNSKVTYYPNPVKDILNVSYNKEISKISVFDLSGKQVYTQDINNKHAQINLSHLATGVYIVKAEISGEIKTFKIIKK